MYSVSVPECRLCTKLWLNSSKNTLSMKLVRRLFLTSYDCQFDVSLILVERKIKTSLRPHACCVIEFDPRFPGLPSRLAGRRIKFPIRRTSILYKLRTFIYNRKRGQGTTTVHHSFREPVFFQANGALARAKLLREASWLHWPWR